MLQGIQNNSFGFNKSIVATDLDGKQIEVASCYTSLVLGESRQSLSVSIEVEKPNILATHKEQVQEQINAFFVTVNAMASAQGMLLITPAEAKKGDI